MTHVTATELQTNLPALLRKVRRGERVMLRNSRGKDVAGLLCAEDIALLERLMEEAEDRLDVELYRQAKREMEESGEQPIPWEQAKRELGVG